MVLLDGDQPTVLSVQKYESGPPVDQSFDGQLVSSDGDTVAATKQEEWIKKKKVELTTTKQIETRVKRQIVLEDGKVVDDSGPIVTTNTTEDTDKKESEQTEHLTHGDDMEGKEGWVVVEALPDDAVVKETNERKVTTHDEVEDVLETEEVQHLGNVSNAEILRAIREGATTRKTLLSPSERKELQLFSGKESGQKRVLQQSRRHDRTTDIEDTKEVSKVKEDGNVVTEITRRHEHEVFHNEDIPDSDSDEFEQIENREGVHDYSHGKSENFIEYVAVPKGGSPSQGVKIGDGANFVSENINTHREGDEDLWDSVSERIRRLPKAAEALFTQTNVNIPANAQPSRQDALTNRPLDLDQEEYTRKNETNRWLNSHFGSSSSSLNSEASPRSPLHSTPTGIHVTMTSRGSPLHSPPPPPPPIPGGGGGGGVTSNNSYHHQHQYSQQHRSSPRTLPPGKLRKDKEPVGKRISFGDSPAHRQNHSQNSVHFDLRNRHHQDDYIRSLNSQLGRVSVTKSGTSLWDEEPTPTPPPRSRRRNGSPDFRAYDGQTRHINLTGSMNNNFSSRHYASESPSYLQKTGDIGERKSYERRDQSFAYNGPNTGGLSRDSLDNGHFSNSGYVTKHSNQYKTNENTNPSQNTYYENGEADVTERKTVERRERVFSYDGASQKQFHPKYIVGTPSSTMNRLKGIEHTGAVIENNNALVDRSQTLPRRRFYFGDDEGSLLGKDTVSKRTPGKSLRFGSDDIDVSISNSYQNAEQNRKSNSLSRSMSFTPRSMGRDNLHNGHSRPAYNPPRLTSESKYSPTYKSNPQLLDAPDLLAPKLLQNMSRSTRDVNSYDSYHHNNYSNNYSTNRHYETANTNHVTTNNSSTQKTKRGLFDSIKKNSVELFESMRGSKATSPARSMTPTNAYSPLRNNNDRTLMSTRQSPRHYGGGNSPLSDDYHETYRMSSSTPDQDETKPKIKTDTTSKFSRKTIRSDDGRPIGNVESSQTTTRTTSRYKESEVMYPNGRGIHSPLGYHLEGPPHSPKQLSSGTVVIPVRDTNNNKNHLNNY